VKAPGPKPGASTNFATFAPASITLARHPDSNRTQ
jgi:hypothetical protein